MLFNLRIVYSLPSYMNSTKFKLEDHFIFFCGVGRSGGGFCKDSRVLEVERSGGSVVANRVAKLRAKSCWLCDQIFAFLCFLFSKIQRLRIPTYIKSEQHYE